MTQIAFEPLEAAHLTRLHGWLQAPHVREFWDDGDRTPAQVWAHYLAEPEDSWIFTLDGRPAGYIQAYPVDAESEFAAYRASVGETWGLDLFIGEVELLGRGYAVGIIEAFLEHLSALHAALSRVLIDPETRNGRAIHVYGKAGLQPLAVVEHKGKRLALMARYAGGMTATSTPVTGPEVLYPLGDEIGSVALVQFVGDDKAIVNAARVSFGGDNAAPLNERDEKLIGYLLREKHGSPFEHNSLTFKVVAPIFVVRQWMRHRIASYNEISGRYVEVKEQVYTPSSFRQQAKSNRQASVEASEALDQAQAHAVWAAAWTSAYGAYQQLLALGVTREQARGVLPLSLYTEFYFTCNVRALLHFLELRDHKGAQYETQLYARALAALAEPLFPATFRAWRALQAHA